MKMYAILQGLISHCNFFVCLQLYDIRCNSLIVGGIQLAMILHRTGSLLYQKMLPHGDALPVRKTEERFLQCSLRGDLQKGRQFSWKNPDRIELSSNKLLILLLIHRSQSLLRLEMKWVMCKESSLPSGAVFLLRFLLNADGSVLLFLEKFPGPRKLTRRSRREKRESKQNDLREKATFVVVSDVCGLLFLFHSISQNSSQPAT
jgi:hypothetical protein